MKLKIFRIIIACSFLFLALLGLSISAYNIILAAKEIRHDDSYLLLLISLLIGSLFLFFEFYFVIKSFKGGTVLLHELTMKGKTNFRRVSTLVGASIVAFLSLAFLIFNALIYTNVLQINASQMTCEFDMFISLLFLANALEVLFYWLFIAEVDIEIFNN